jgi:hypothetical protein
LFEHVLKQRLNVVVDGTFAHKQALPNIRHSISHKRTTEILFVYQDPVSAWEFTKKREVVEGRKITKERFVSAYFESQLNVLNAIEEFGTKISLNLLIKDYRTGFEELRLDIKQLDPYLKRKYSKGELEEILV